MRFIWLLRAKSAAWLGRGSWRSIVAGNIFNSQGIHVAVVVGTEIFDLMGRKLYNLKGSNIYRPSGELVGHMNDTRGPDKRLAHSTDRLFPGHH
jgi:coproporphyrinogen III oxidase